MATWAIGDVHGCFQSLRALIENKIIPSRGDEFIFLGDYIDRGPQSKQSIDYIIGLEDMGFEVKSILGNHEKSMIDAYHEDFNLKPSFWKKPKNLKKIQWYSYGGNKTMESFGTDDLKQIPEHYIKWLEGLSYYFVTQDFVLVHAGLNFENEDPFEDKHSMLWIRDFKPEPEKIQNRKVIHGHIPVHLDFIKESVQSSMYQFIDLDNGCVYPDRPGQGNLVAMNLQSKQLAIQPNIDMI
jgi:serine/threonine protein phosphatase 1